MHHYPKTVFFRGVEERRINKELYEKFPGRLESKSANDKYCSECNYNYLKCKHF
jgi:hypothetical protein